MIILPPVPVDSEHGRIGWHNLVTTENVEATSADVGFPALNLANPTTFQLWRGAAIGSATVTVLFGDLTQVDYVGVARHNFGSAGIGYTLQGTVDGSIWTDLDTPQAPNDDGVIIHEFTSAELLGVRLVLGAGSAKPQAAVLHVGRITVLQRRIYVGHRPIPYARDTTVSTGMSESGQFLGRTTIRQMFRTQVQLSNLTPEWYRDTLEPYAAVAAVQPFFWAWRPNPYPFEVAYCWATEDPEVNNERANGMMSFALNMQGVLA
jgi:hypothetical protein